MVDNVPLGTRPYLFEPEASSDEEFNQQSSPSQPTKTDWETPIGMCLKTLLRIYFANKSFF